MKISEPIHVAGYYLQNDGKWQSSSVLTDGVKIVEVTSSHLGKAPAKVDAALTGVESAERVALPKDMFSQTLGGPVVSDFRSADIAMGGLGAPLHPFYLHALARNMGTRPLAFLLLEDVTTLVWVDPLIADPTDAQAITCFETGPCLGPLREIAPGPDRGEVVDGALELFLDDAYFRKLPPKRVQRSNFTHLLDLVWELTPADATATLLGMAATSVLLGLEHLPAQPERFIAAGAGVSNPLLMHLLRAALDTRIDVLDPIVNAHTLHAQAIAFLAARVAKGLPTTAPHTTGVAAAVGGGNLADFA